MRIVHSGKNYGGDGRGTSRSSNHIRDTRPTGERILRLRVPKKKEGQILMVPQWKRSFSIPIPHQVYRGSVTDALYSIRKRKEYPYRTHVEKVGEAIFRQCNGGGRTVSLKVLLLSEGVFASDPHNPTTGGIVLLQFPDGTEVVSPRKFFEQLTEVPKEALKKKVKSEK